MMTVRGGPFAGHDGAHGQLHWIFARVFLALWERSPIAVPNNLEDMDHFRSKREPWL